MLQRALILAVLALAPACRGTSSYQKPPLPPQDVEVSRPDVARVYVLRDGQVRGKVRALRVEAGDRDVGAIDQGEYLCWEMTPGRVLLSFVYEGARIDGGDLEGLYSLDAEPGRAYYLAVGLERKADDPELRARAGHPEIVLLDPAAGREKIASRAPAAGR